MSTNTSSILLLQFNTRFISSVEQHAFVQNAFVNSSWDQMCFSDLDKASEMGAFIAYWKSCSCLIITWTWWRCHTQGWSSDCQFLAETHPLSKGKHIPLKFLKCQLLILNYLNTTISTMKSNPQEGITGKFLQFIIMCW